LENGNSGSYPLPAIFILAYFPQETNLQVKRAVCGGVHKREKARKQQSGSSLPTLEVQTNLTPWQKSQMFYISKLPLIKTVIGKRTHPLPH